MTVDDVEAIAAELSFKKPFVPFGYALPVITQNEH